MRVLSLIRRDQGHEVVMEGISYAFRRPDWACEVRDPRHAARFAAIKEGYRLEPEPLALAATAQPTRQAVETGPTERQPGLGSTEQESVASAGNTAASAGNAAPRTGMATTPRRRGRPRKPETGSG